MKMLEKIKAKFGSCCCGSCCSTPFKAGQIFWWFARGAGSKRLWICAMLVMCVLTSLLEVYISYVSRQPTVPAMIAHSLNACLLCWLFHPSLSRLKV